MSGRHRGGDALKEWEWTAPEDGETKTIVVAVFHWSTGTSKSSAGKQRAIQTGKQSGGK